MADIESLHIGSTDYKVRYMLQAVRLRKQRSSVRQISKILGVAKSTVYEWLRRLAVGGIERIVFGLKIRTNFPKNYCR